MKVGAMKMIEPVRHRSIYGDKQPHELPAYTCADVARYLRIPVATIRSWVKGYWYTTNQGTREFRRVITPAEEQYLSFQNLIELFVLGAIRRTYNVQLHKVRTAIPYLERVSNTEHPLADCNLWTDKRDLFIEFIDQYLNVSVKGQVEMKDLKQCLTRIEKDPRGIPVRLFPFIRSNHSYRAKSIVIDPTIQFGRPCIAGTGVPTEVVFSRSQAGETSLALASDYKCSVRQIADAVHYEKAIWRIAA
jgi:uncharacterized protein (DUF433 family)